MEVLLLQGQQTVERFLTLFLGVGTVGVEYRDAGGGAGGGRQAGGDGVAWALVMIPCFSISTEVRTCATAFILPYRTFSPVPGSRVKPTPVPESSPRLPNRRRSSLSALAEKLLRGRGRQDARQPDLQLRRLGGLNARLDVWRHWSELDLKQPQQGLSLPALLAFLAGELLPTRNIGHLGLFL